MHKSVIPAFYTLPLCSSEMQRQGIGKNPRICLDDIGQFVRLVVYDKLEETPMSETNANNAIYRQSHTNSGYHEPTYLASNVGHFRET